MLFQPIGSASWPSIGAFCPFGSWMTLLFVVNRGERSQLLPVFSTGQLQTDFTAGKYGLFCHKDGCDDSYFLWNCMKENRFFSPHPPPPPVTCVDVYWKLLWICRCGMGMCPHDNSVLGFFSGCLRGWGFLDFFFLLLFLLYFFSLQLQLILTRGGFLIGVQWALTFLWLPSQAVLIALCAIVMEGQPLQVAVVGLPKIHVCMPLGTSESVPVPETCRPFSHISVGWTSAL